MELYYFGEEESCRLQLCNGFTVMIDYGGSDKDFDSSKNNYNAIYRRVRLFNDKQELLSELVEENPCGRQEFERVQDIERSQS